MVLKLVPAGQCQPLLDKIHTDIKDPEKAYDPDNQYVALYRGIAEGCVGQLTAARTDLGEARQVGLDDNETGDPSCNAQRLLAFGFDTYLNTPISPRCLPPRTTTTEEPTSTTTSTTA